MIQIRMEDESSGGLLTFRDGLLTCNNPLVPVLCPFITAFAGVTGEGSPFAGPTFLGLGAFRGLVGSSRASLLGAGVRLLLGPLVAEPLICGSPLASLGELFNGFL